MLICEAIYDDLDWLKYEENSEQYIEYFYKIMDSDLSILRIYISICESNRINKNIKAKVNNSFYCNCIFHSAEDLPLRIVEDKKAFACYGCDKSGTIVSLISNFYNISMKEAVELLYSYINNVIKVLNKEQLDILKDLLQYYDTPIAEELFEESRRKTEFLNERIKKYISDKNCHHGDEEKIANRLCCAKKYVKMFIPISKKIDRAE